MTESADAAARPAKPGPATPAPTDTEIYDAIVAAVHDHRLLPGTKLVEDKLGQIYGVSRTRIRQVLIRLAHEQIVTLSPNRGASIARLSVQEAREVFEVRRLIEPTLLRRFIERAVPADIDALSAHIESEEVAAQRADRPLALTLSGAFHLRIADAADHATLARMLREMVSRTSLVLMSFGAGPPPRKSASAAAQWVDGCRCHEHRALLAAIVARDADAATVCMQQHLQQIETGLSLQLPEPQDVDLFDLLRVTPAQASPTPA